MARTKAAREQRAQFLRFFGPVFEPLKDPSYFGRLAVNPDLDTIVWPNGADFAPEFLHQRVQDSAAEVAEP